MILAPVPKRNFIKENMVHLKRMQGYVDDPSSHSAYRKLKKLGNPELTPNQRTMKLIRTTRKQLEGLAKLSKSDKSRDSKFSATSDEVVIPFAGPAKNAARKKCMNVECPVHRTAVEAYKDGHSKKLKETGIQTEQYTTVRQLYETGVIKYPSSQVMQAINQNKSTTQDDKLHKGDGDYRKRSPDLLPPIKNNSTDTSSEKRSHDFIKENAQVIKTNAKNGPQKDPTMAPPTYQKGVIPKYLRERKEELHKLTRPTEGDEKCPDGHVILPENERKETLRMLRQSKCISSKLYCLFLTPFFHNIILLPLFL